MVVMKAYIVEYEWVSKEDVALAEWMVVLVGFESVRK